MLLKCFPPQVKEGVVGLHQSRPEARSGRSLPVWARSPKTWRTGLGSRNESPRGGNPRAGTRRASDAAGGGEGRPGQEDPRRYPLCGRCRPPRCRAPPRTRTPGGLPACPNIARRDRPGRWRRRQLRDGRAAPQGPTQLPEHGLVQHASADTGAKRRTLERLLCHDSELPSAAAAIGTVTAPIRDARLDTNKIATVSVRRCDEPTLSACTMTPAAVHHRTGAPTTSAEPLTGGASE